MSNVVHPPMSPRSYRENVLDMTIADVVRRTGYAESYIQYWESKGFPPQAFAERMKRFCGVPENCWYDRGFFTKCPARATATASVEQPGGVPPSKMGKPSRRGNIASSSSSRTDGAGSPEGNPASPTSSNKRLRLRGRNSGDTPIAGRKSRSVSSGENREAAGIGDSGAISVDALRLAAGMGNGLPGVRTRMGSRIPANPAPPSEAAPAEHDGSVIGLIGAFLALHLCSAGARIRFAQSGIPSCLSALQLYTSENVAAASNVLAMQGMLDVDDVRAALGAFEAFLSGANFPDRGTPDLPTYYSE